MSLQKYFSGLFMAGVLLASPMVGMAEDYADSPGVDEYGEKQREMMMEQRGQESAESLAQSQTESEETLAAIVCHSEGVIDENTGEIIAFWQICQETSDLA